jgi:asparagine synthase (glutamine-hydrolysing)
MCGISIAISRKDELEGDDLIKAMNAMVSHRGPDNDGIYIKGNLALGHRRLSILDLSTASHQPMQRKNCIITYNGEVYNYIELREELQKLGHTFITSSDTEVILSAYQHWGTDAFKRFNGMWAFALYDSEKNDLIFCRDHFGIKPLYFTETDNYFLAGSEIKQFKAVHDFRSILDKKSVVNFLAKGWLNYSSATFFEGVQELRPGCYLKYNLNEHSFIIKQWYDLDASVMPIKISEKEAIEEVRKLFLDSVKIRMRSDVKVGSCLSGGIDSSSIVATVHSNAMANDAFATITSCYSDQLYDEQRFSDKVTDQTKFKAIKVFPDLNNLWDEKHFDKMIFHQDQPFNSASHYSEFNVFKTAREHGMIVMLDGQGSDEYLCGYGEFFIIYVKSLLRSFRFRKVVSELKCKATHRKRSLLKEIKAFIKSAYFYPIADGIKSVAVKKKYRWLADSWSEIARREVVDFNSKNIRHLSIEEISYSSIPYQLHSEDRNSMMFSIESRLPFLDHRLVEYVIGLPDSYKIKNGYTKHVLREAISELPEEIRFRKDKMGFVAPDEVWMRKNSIIVRKELEEAVNQRGFFTSALLTRFDLFVENKLAYEPIYFRAMALNRFCKIFNMEILL